MKKQQRYFAALLLVCCVLTACREKASYKKNLEYFQELDEVREEISVKLDRIQKFLEEEKLDGMLLSRVDNIAWITAGLCRAYDAMNAGVGMASLLILKDGKKYLICAESNAKRLMDENLEFLGYEAKTYSWYDARTKRPIVARMVLKTANTDRIGSDLPVSGFVLVDSRFDRLRDILTPQEIERYRWLGRETAEAVTDVFKKVQPGMDEYEIEYLMSRELLSRGVLPARLLISMDERILAYGRTLPGGATLKKMAMIGVTGKKWGISVALTRLLHLGPPYRDVEERIRKVIEMSARFQEATEPGKSIYEIFDESKTWYEEAGYLNEWQKYHSGGFLSDNSRKCDNYSKNKRALKEKQIFAWHPTIKGVSIEDTFIVYENSIEVVTFDERWPLTPVEINGKVHYQPDVMIR
jgi:antitoxin VapB